MSGKSWAAKLSAGVIALMSLLAGVNMLLAELSRTRDHVAAVFEAKETGPFIPTEEDSMKLRVDSLWSIHHE